LYYSTRNSSSKDGVVILFSAKWQDKFVTWGEDPAYQEIWVLFDIDGMYFGIINVYASIDLFVRCTL